MVKGGEKMLLKPGSGRSVAATITRESSKQTYYTILLFMDRDLIDDAYRAYAYFRWVDDFIDEHTDNQAERSAFVRRQKDLLEAYYQGLKPEVVCVEESMLVDLVSNDTGRNPGLQSYLRNMMAVMEFDAKRRGRVITHTELTEYAHTLATAVMDYMYYFIGHDDPAPLHPARYQAVTAAHITHMLRDTRDDVENGYFNIPKEYLIYHGISPQDVDTNAYRSWVCSRVQLARRFFKAGREYLAQDKNYRRRLAGYAYTARFEWILRIIERENYCLRSDYSQRRSLSASLWMGWQTLLNLLTPRVIKTKHSKLAVYPYRSMEL